MGDEINLRFTYHAPSESQVQQYSEIRGHAKNMARVIDSECPESREKALALTKLEESVMWANAAIARRS